MTGFATATAALAQIVECLDGFCNRVHVGSRDTGLSIDVCGKGVDCLLRVEDGGVHPGNVRSLAVLGKCMPAVLDVIITYRVCFQVNTVQGHPRPMAELTAEGTAITTSWTDALRRLSCCKPSNQNLRLVQVITDPPDGGVAGWTMNLEADLHICGGCP